MLAIIYIYIYIYNHIDPCERETRADKVALIAVLISCLARARFTRGKFIRPYATAHRASSRTSVSEISEHTHVIIIREAMTINR